jgi:hypothetical protein
VDLYHKLVFFLAKCFRGRQLFSLCSIVANSLAAEQRGVNPEPVLK